MVPQYCSYGSAGVPAVPATIFMSGSMVNQMFGHGEVTIFQQRVMIWENVSLNFVELPRLTQDR